MIAIATKAIMLEIKSINNRLKTPCKENMPFIAKDKRPRTAKSTRDAAPSAKNVFGMIFYRRKRWRKNA